MELKKNIILFGAISFFLFVVLLAVALVHGKDESSGSSGETDYDNSSFFINSVHSVASDVAKVIQEIEFMSLFQRFHGA